MSFETAKDVGFDLGPFSFKMSRPKSEQLRLHTLISDLAFAFTLASGLVSLVFSDDGNEQHVGSPELSLPTAQLSL